MLREYVLELAKLGRYVDAISLPHGKKKIELKNNVDKYRFKVDELKISQNVLNIKNFFTTLTES